MAAPAYMRKKSPLLDAVHMATQKLASVEDLDVVLKDVLSICIEAVDAEGGTVYLHDPIRRRLRFVHVLPEEVAQRLERLDIPDDFGVAGAVFQSGMAELSKFPVGGDPDSKNIEQKSGVTVRTMLTLPLQITGMRPIGVIQLVNKRSGIFTEDDEAVLDIISDVSTLAVTNSRLLQQRAHVASLEGMGRAAHDLANKAGALNAFLPDFERNLEALRGVLRLQGVKGEACLYLDMLEGTFHDVFAPYSERVYRYARLVNDLAAGKKLTPKLKVQSFAHVIEDAAQYVEPSAKRSHLKIEYELDYQAPEFAFDDLYVIRIVENLLGNAIKAMKETIPNDWLAQNGHDPDAIFGSIIVRTKYEDGSHILEVADKGPGLSPQQIKEILSGSARSAWEQSSGTGLGTKVILDLAQTHNAKLAINSRLGEGSTFRLTFPG